MGKIATVTVTDKYRAIRMGSSELGETNDCAVVAIAIACNVTYAEAHAELERLGRRRRRGTFMHHTEQAVAKFGKKLERVEPRSFLDTYPGVHKGTHHVTTHHPRRFPQCFDKNKTYLFRTSRHILAVTGGVVHDWTINTAKRVIQIYEVK